ncbi:MAG: T9SS C-terminal target domain-containing protein [Stygiobacter sp.]|nr:MAG: hypothetical protein A2X62_13420 [Stygiobacter sp. GWC2_38_9]OGV06128.1 MAG: hypothetical protein A2299_07965 [Stygiobacter sp. RIFOXYB2_FULL_37_11]OGV11367.1 MAG: hypothetical protein A2237_10700 [Stygiobacter sp. RIFOXYA2_FULL_38_8]OGV16807.1 MAG: hypothetical protein A2440_05550 [Stygiobacter sp. RIFOXYC2_FULL_38_25]OGV82842.1 MAG: hypothetical protein A2X65_12605 [Stygiobacter sp. GWF2_38_21]RJQ61703.1 MAG: T9SS C-terminal target domain-containing protein [Stygiobacter sp.]
MKELLFTVTVLLFFYSTSLAQQSEWKVYDPTNSGLPDKQINSIHIDDQNVKWIGTSSGLVKFDNSNWTLFNTTNSPLPSNYITGVASDGKNSTWIGTDSGIAHLTNGNWEVFRKANSAIVSNSISQVKFASGAIWFTTDKGLMKFSNNQWQIYDSNNSGLYIDFVCSVVADKDGTIWSGTFNYLDFNGVLISYNNGGWTYYKLKDHGLFSSFPDALVYDSQNNMWLGTKGTTGGALVKIRGTVWTVYDKNNSGYKGGGINSIAIEGDDKWIGGNGVTLFKDGKWTTFNKSNSGLPDDFVSEITIDKFGNKWIATISGGLAVYKKDGVISSVVNDNKPVNSTFQLFDNYPNPFNNATKVRFSIPARNRIQLKLYDILGRELSTLIDELKDAGVYEAVVNLDGYPSGVYLCKLTSGNFSSVKKLIYLK